MNTNKDREDRFLLSFADILSLFRQSKLKILCCAVVMGLFGAYWGLSTPIRYQAEGTFREKGIKSNNFSSSSVLHLLGGGSFIGGESETTSLMTSRKILKEVIRELNLQANIEAKPDIETLSRLIKRNFMLAWSSTFSRSVKPVLKDLSCPLKIKTVNYTGEIPQSFMLNLHEDGYYEVLDLINNQKTVGWGKLGEPFQFEELSITLIPTNSDQPISPQSFCLTVDSLNNTVKSLCTFFKVEPTKLDKSLLLLKCEHRDRYKASAIVNAVMDNYQTYLKDYHKDMALTQLDYLNLRRDQLTQNLTNLMQKHADYLANDLYNSGFIESNKEMDFLAKSQHEYKQKLLDNELEIKRLTNIKPENFSYYDRYSTNEGDPAILNSIFSEMRSLKQQRDALEIELQKKSVHQGAELQISFDEQLNELKEVQQYLTELREISYQYEQGNLPDSNSKLLNDSRFLLKRWFEQLQNIRGDNSSHLKETKENFQFYLNNLERLFGVHERILQERLTHQQNPSGEYQGISLEMATSLYLDYSKQYIQIEGTIRQNSFFIHQIEDPNFEITSLSSGLTDPVSSAMIHKASELVLNLRDQNNQSIREQERIKEELNLQRTFLNMHLKQMVQLMELNKELMDEKIFSLQNISLELIHQRISLLEKNLQDYLKSRLFNLQQERNLIKRHLESIHGDMALLPKKWVSEQLITQEVDTNHLIVEEIAKLVESKNISHKLEVIQSAPVDIAIPPVHPMTPKVFLWGLIGFFFGGIVGSVYVLGKTLNKGLNVSIENLELLGYHVSGLLSDSLSSTTNEQERIRNIDTIRRLQAYFDSSLLAEPSSAIQGAKLLLLIEGSGPDYAADLADLFQKRNRRVLTLDLNFEENRSTSTPGLLQYLQGEISTLPIQKGLHGDWIAAGGTCNFVIEIIGSHSFQKMIEQLKPHYDWIIAVSRALPCSIEAETLLTLFSNAAITLKQERVAELNIFNHFLEQIPSSKLTFILEKQK